MRDLDFLLDFKPNNDNGIIEIESFDISPRKRKKSLICIKSFLELEYKSDYEIHS